MFNEFKENVANFEKVEISFQGVGGFGLGTKTNSTTSMSHIK